MDKVNEYKGDGGKNGMEGRVERKTWYWILRNERAGGCYMTGFFFFSLGYVTTAWGPV